MLDRDRLEELLEAMTEHLEGDWLLVGGAIVALWLEPRRVTEDIDILGLGGTQGERLRLMEFAESQGLPIEAVNSAVDFLVQRIPGWRDEIEVFRQKGRVRIFRPSPTLFLLLKIKRLSEQDLEDCLKLLDRVNEEGWSLDTARVAQALDDLGMSEDPELETRRHLLRRRLAPDNQGFD